MAPYLLDDMYEQGGSTGVRQTPPG